MIRPATSEDLAQLQEIERAAGAPFREVGMAVIADDEPPTLPQLQRYVDAGRAWVAQEQGRPAAYLIAELVDGLPHIEQVSVHPQFARRGLGRALISHCATWAAECGHRALTLTTFVDVPWNGPYYRRLGFRPLEPAELTPGLRALREHEAARGLDRWPRECLRLDLPAARERTKSAH